MPATVRVPRVSLSRAWVGASGGRHINAGRALQPGGDSASVRVPAVPPSLCPTLATARAPSNPTWWGRTCPTPGTGMGLRWASQAVLGLGWSRHGDPSTQALVPWDPALPVRPGPPATVCCITGQMVIKARDTTSNCINVDQPSTDVWTKAWFANRGTQAVESPWPCGDGRLVLREGGLGRPLG